ncbi:MAG: AAA family ATPase [Treponema sp.]|nr:AAA family ATPase [Treponema sp.]
MTYNSQNLRRLSEVLQALNLDAEYYKKEGIFICKNSDFVIYENLTNYEEIKKRLANKKFIKLENDGQLLYEDASPVIIKHCSHCNSFYFSQRMPRQKENCPNCGLGKIKQLSNNGKIPGWYGKEETVLFDEQEANNHLGSCDANTRQAIKPVLNQLSGNPKYIVMTPEKIEKVKELQKKYPNMDEVINYLLQCTITSNMKRNQAFSFKPFVLLGGPGCGKTSFTAELCEIILEKRALKIDLGNNIANFTISGSDPSYKNAKYGLIVESMFSGENDNPLKNPIIHFDELDKVNGSNNYSIETIFYSILEKNNAKRFFDNYIGINIDASGINYIFTANSLEKIPLPIINRLKIFKIEDYSEEQLRGPVIDSFYNNWLHNNNMEEEYLPRILSDEIKARILELSNQDPRSIEDAIGKVFSETLQVDKKTKHAISLFSPEEIYKGWENFRGERCISKKTWKLPEGFIKKNPYYEVEYTLS